MENLFVPYELAVKLKEKGFDEPCFSYYTHPDNVIDFVTDGHGRVSSRRNSQFGLACSAPIYDQVIEWLDERGIHVQIHCNFESPYCYGFIINKSLFIGMPNKFEFRREALNKSIVDSLNRI